MTQTALKYPANIAEIARPVLVHSRPAESSKVRVDQEIFVLGGILIFLQILDGLLTGVGISQFGIQAEGNILIRSLMDHLGYIPALIAVKGIAIGVICGLCALAGLVAWLATAMRAVIVVYLAAAIIPWTSILIHHLI